MKDQECQKLPGPTPRYSVFLQPDAKEGQSDIDQENITKTKQSSQMLSVSCQWRCEDIQPGLEGFP